MRRNWDKLVNGDVIFLPAVDGLHGIYATVDSPLSPEGSMWVFVQLSEEPGDVDVFEIFPEEYNISSVEVFTS